MDLVGKTLLAIRADTRHLVFETPDGVIAYETTDEARFTRFVNPFVLLRNLPIEDVAYDGENYFFTVDHPEFGLIVATLTVEGAGDVEQIPSDLLDRQTLLSLPTVTTDTDIADLKAPRL